MALQWQVARHSWLCIQTQQELSSRVHDLLPFALFLQFLASQLLFWQNWQPGLSVFNTLASISLLICALLYLNTRYRPFHALYPWVLAINSFLLLAALLLPNWLLAKADWSWLLASHIILALTSYSLLSMTGIMALVLLIQTKQFRQHRISRAVFSLPPLQWTERLHFELLLLAFVCLTLAMSAGLVNQQSAQGLIWTYWHKGLGSLATWLILAATLLGHLLAGWRGILAAKLTLAGLAVLSASYLITKLWLT